jgi:5-deoxy-5-amino-3-dehydroquinate synthase
MIVVPVALAERPYDVLIGPDVRRELAAVIAGRLPEAAQAAVVTQAGIAAAAWFGDLDPGLPFSVHEVADGEAAKSMATVETLCGAFAESGLTRSDVVIAVGGGIVTDVAGFAAATYHRGTPYVNVATTLLGQVDAAIGGKTAVNLPQGKNLVGAFWQPAAVLCDTTTLRTLSARDWACGRGEMAKYAFLGPAPDASLLELSIDEQVARCVTIKAEVVASDEREDGRRMLLNYGHTLAHALEAQGFETSADLRHGEAVAIGLVFAALLAQRLERIDEERVALHRRVVAGFDLAADLPAGADPERLVAAMARDKKARHDLTFVLDGPAGVETVRGIAPSDVLATLALMGATPVGTA